MAKRHVKKQFSLHSKPVRSACCAVCFYVISVTNNALKTVPAFGLHWTAFSFAEIGLLALRYALRRVICVFWF